MRRTLACVGVLLATAVATGAQQDQLRDLAERLRALSEELARLAGPPPPAEAAVDTADELRQALAAGGAIRLAPGRYAGNFVAAVDGTRLLGAALPERRVAPADVEAFVLEPADRYRPTLTVTGSDVRVEGLTVLLGNKDREALVVGRIDATSAAEQPAGVVLDRLAVLAGADGGRRGVALHARGATLVRSYVAGFWFRYQDSQAVWMNNGPGPYALVDNYLEGSGENVMAGGSEIYIPDVVPSDVLVARNTIRKPEEWRALGGSVKNSVEFKAVRRALVEDNLIDGNWRDAQGGDTIVLTPRNPSGRNPWVVVEDVVVRGNVVRRAREGYAVAILGTDNNNPTGQTARVTLERNLFEDATGGVKVIGGVAGHLRVANNTFPAVTGNWFLFSGTTVPTPLTATANVAKSGAYGVSGGTTVGEPSLLANTTGLVFTGNVVEKYCCRTIRWPAGNTLLEPGALAALLDPQTFRHPDPALGY